MWNKLTGFARRNKAEGSESRLREPRTGNTTIAIETAREVLTARRLERTFCAELLGVSSFINSVNPLERRVMKRVDRVSGKGADIAALVPRVPKAVPGLMQSFSDETRSGEQLAAEIDALHFALGPYQEDDTYPVAVVDRARIERWLGQLEEVGLQPDHLVPDLLALPREDDWVLWIGYDY